MNALRVARAATRVRPCATRVLPQRRGYADAVSDKIKFTLALPHQVNTVYIRPASSPITILHVCLTTY